VKEDLRVLGYSNKNCEHMKALRTLFEGAVSTWLKHLNSTGEVVHNKVNIYNMYKNNIPYLNLMSIKYRVIILEDRRKARLDKYRLGLASWTTNYRMDDSPNGPNMAHILLNVSTSMEVALNRDEWAQLLKKVRAQQGLSSQWWWRLPWKGILNS